MFLQMKTETTGKNYQARNFTIIPSKKQSDFLKGKFGAGGGARNKNSTASVSKRINVKKDISKNTPKMGLGRGGKNLALLKQKNSCSISEQSSEESTISTPNSKQLKPITIKIEQTSKHNDETTTKQAANSQEEQQQQQQQHEQQNQTVKRKLNLEEYKKRRGEPLCSSFNSTCYKIPKKEPIATKPQVPNNMPQKHSEAVTSVVRSLKEAQCSNNNNKIPTDPITLAKNKVLRMQELKKQQQLKIIDSTVSAKVPRVTKLLPLSEIVKDTYGAAINNDSLIDAKNVSNNQKIKQEFEEIIIVSASCNTDISLPPVLNAEALNLRHVNNVSRSLLKSSALLQNISTSFQKVQSQDAGVKITPSSLISSIQNEVVKQVLPPALNLNSSNEKPLIKAEKPKDEVELPHGEDKIIMHLRKDRIRKQTATIGTQTEVLPEFPVIPLSTRQSRERIRRKVKQRRYRKHEAYSSSDEEDNLQSHHFSNSTALFNENCSYRSRSRSSSDAHSIPSYSSSVERMHQFDAGCSLNTASIAAGGYSSRSSRRHRSSISSSYSESGRVVAANTAKPQRRQRKTSYKQRNSKKYARSSSTSSQSDYSSRYRSRSRSPLSRRGRSRSIRRYNNNNINGGGGDRNVSKPGVY